MRRNAEICSLKPTGKFLNHSSQAQISIQSTGVSSSISVYTAARLFRYGNPLPSVIYSCSHSYVSCHPPAHIAIILSCTSAALLRTRAHSHHPHSTRMLGHCRSTLKCLFVPVNGAWIFSNQGRYLWEDGQSFLMSLVPTVVFVHNTQRSVLIHGKEARLALEPTARSLLVECFRRQGRVHHRRLRYKRRSGSEVGRLVLRRVHVRRAWPQTERSPRAVEGLAKVCHAEHTAHAGWPP